MRTTIVPAQITTVEDKIARNLNLTQICLLLTPIFLGSGIYICFPPFLHFAVYKLILMLCITSVSCGLAIRCKERMILQWIGILLRYTSRPRYFICNKNDTVYRDVGEATAKKHVPAVAMTHKKIQGESIQEISFGDKIKLDFFFGNPKAQVSFKRARKGGMYVSISEIK